MQRLSSGTQQHRHTALLVNSPRERLRRHRPVSTSLRRPFVEFKASAKTQSEIFSCMLTSETWMPVAWSLLRWIKMGSLLPGTRDVIPMTGIKKAQKKGDRLKNQPEISNAWDCPETLSWLGKTCKNLNKRGKTNDKPRQTRK